MNFKKGIAILIVLIFIASTMSAVSADDVEYSLTNGLIDLIVEENGLLHVKEVISYHFDSSANGVYRNIPLKDNQEIKNLKVSTKGAYCNYSVTYEDNKAKIKVYLYKDSGKTQKISPNTNVDVKYEYDMTHVIKLYTDTGELHYKLWGDEWEADVAKVTALIHFPNKKGVEYWLNPYTKGEGSWKNNTLTVKSDYIVSGDYLEIRASIPLSEFKNPIYGQVINSPGLAEMKKIQEDYENSNKFANTGFLVIDILAIISLIIPILIYIKEGREPKIAYNGIYEREPPTKDAPAFVNAMQSGLGKTIGKPDKQGFQGTIMDLINRKFISISNEEKAMRNSAIMEINYDKINELKDFERDVINILKPFEINGKISLDHMESSLRSSNIAEDFSRSIGNWETNFKYTYLPKSELKKYFIEKGSTYMKTYGIIAIIFAIVLGYFAIGSIVENSTISVLVAVFIGIIGILCLVIPSTVGGRWTEYGAEYNAKWKNFKKYLKDYSLIKEHPPESIAIWNEYLVYATALGVADEVYKSMKMMEYTGNDYYLTNPLFMFYYFGGHHSLDHAINTGISTASANNSIGGIGGGSGGGGGGAF
ncbi:MAG: DUF2207 domain-containing protein [Methanobacteriaceae archaeon]|nr:DUF2207 domain-containing protein [Methanobacteriaceae archaeon]